MLLLLHILALAACTTLAAPAISSPPQLPFNSTKNTTESYLSSLFTLHNDPLNTVFIVSAPFLNLNHTNTTSFQSTQFENASTITPTTPLSFVSSFTALSSVSFTPRPSIIFTNDVTTVFETSTVDKSPSSTTNVTVSVTKTTTTTATAPTTPSPSWDDLTAWAAPPQMTDLSAFNVTDFPSGQRNLHIVAQIPEKAISPAAKLLRPLGSNDKNGTSTILQLVYPAHSVNPGSKPQGGADFYATPLNLAGARNVTLEYRVFFPADFDWVKGGKLPGLYGGHTGCSGGASARDCFSTRMMWRSRGAGELYLYAPKDKQTDALCDDERSVCDAAYGFSVGRGTFNFTAGDWTHVLQNVVLNTPGENNGVFVLFVDGRLTINRTDIFYRDIVQESDDDDPDATTEFIGLFFSTFFGGHGKQYATPREQYIWFKDFVITRYI